MTGRVSVASTAVWLASVVLAAGACSPPPTDDWLIVDNRTDSRIVITHAVGSGDTTSVDQLAEVGPNTRGFAGGMEFCSAKKLSARVGSQTGRVIDVRPASDGERCVKVWVIEADE